ncbi:hypothetical protein, partial [Cedecea neteri]|uniref:hypothetical protein n=1 Tax=Cedecea neteri TaxID=158822 RepID=UPI001C3F473D
MRAGNKGVAVRLAAAVTFSLVAGLKRGTVAAYKTGLEVNGTLAILQSRLCKFSFANNSPS